MIHPPCFEALVLMLVVTAGCGQSSSGDPSPAVAPEPRAEAAAGKVAPSPVADRPSERCDCDKGNCADAEEEDPRVEQIAVGSSPTRGAEAAPVTVIVFSDFQCPFCRKAEATERELEAAYPGKIRYVWKNQPLPIHPHAPLAAKAALAAGEQGKFWEYQGVLFGHQDALDRASLERYAEELGLDAQRFHVALDDPRLDAALDADRAEAKRLEVKGTPTFFVNGRRVIGAQPLATFKAQVDEALARR